jgi:hypothetical protein
MTHDENEQEGRAFDVTPAKDAPDPKAQERLRVRRWRGFAVLLTLILGPGFGHFILRRVARGSLWLASAWIGDRMRGGAVNPIVYDHLTVTALKAHIVNGRIVVDEPVDLPDGAEIHVYLYDASAEA